MGAGGADVGGCVCAKALVADDESRLAITEAATSCPGLIGSFGCKSRDSDPDAAGMNLRGSRLRRDEPAGCQPAAV
jgi:hypothetical protein